MERQVEAVKEALTVPEEVCVREAVKLCVGELVRVAWPAGEPVADTEPEMEAQKVDEGLDTREVVGAAVAVPLVVLECVGVCVGVWVGAARRAWGGESEALFVEVACGRRAPALQPRRKKPC